MWEKRSYKLKTAVFGIVTNMNMNCSNQPNRKYKLGHGVNVFEIHEQMTDSRNYPTINMPVSIHC